MFYQTIEEAKEIKQQITQYMELNNINKEFRVVYGIYQRTAWDTFSKEYSEELYKLLGDFENCDCELEGMLEEMETDYRNLFIEY